MITPPKRLIVDVTQEDIDIQSHSPLGVGGASVDYTCPHALAVRRALQAAGLEVDSVCVTATRADVWLVVQPGIRWCQYRPSAAADDWIANYDQEAFSIDTTFVPKLVVPQRFYYTLIEDDE